MAKKRLAIDRWYKFQGDPQGRVYLFPLVASWVPGQLPDKVKWIGSPQIQQTFARHLFELWQTLTPGKGGHNSTIAWHTTEGDGYCLVRLALSKGTWHASAVMVSASASAALGFDPFVLMYGGDTPKPQNGVLGATRLRVSKLLEKAEAKITRAYGESKFIEAEGIVDGWWDKIGQTSAPAPLLAESNTQVMLSALLAWSRVPVHERQGVNLILAPQGPLPEGLLHPLMVCARRDDAEPPRREPKPQVAPQPVASPKPARVAKPVEPPPRRQTRPEPAVAPVALAHTEAAPPRPPKPAARPEPKPTPKVEPAPPLGQPPIEAVAVSLTESLLMGLKVGCPPDPKTLENDLRAEGAVDDYQGYGHLLDRLVCGLVEVMADLASESLLSTMAAYNPGTFGLQKNDAAWDSYLETMVDLARLARVGSTTEATERWIAALVGHPREADLLAWGLGRALEPRIERLYREGARASVRGILDSAADERGVDEGWPDRRRRWLAELAPQPVSVELSSPPMLEREPGKGLGAVPERVAVGHLEAIASVGLRSFGSQEDSGVDAVSTNDFKVDPKALEERLMSAWGVGGASEPCLLWEPICGGDAWRSLVELVGAGRGASADTSEIFPIELGAMGPVTSCARLEEAVEICIRTGLAPGWSAAVPGQSETVRFELAGPALTCTPLRNLWARMGRRRGRTTGVGGSGAVIVAASGGAARWPSLVRRADGVIFVADLGTMVLAPHQARESTIEALASLTLARPDDAPRLRCVFVMTGLESLVGTKKGSLVRAVNDALARLSANREAGLAEGLLGDMANLGKLTLKALEADWLSTLIEEYKIDPSFFIVPSLASHAGPWLQDLPLLHLMRACRVKLNLMRRSGGSVLTPRTPSTAGSEVLYGS